MAEVWTVLIQYFICVFATLNSATAETQMVTFPGNGVVDINCAEDLISIENITVVEANTNCVNRENCTISNDMMNSIISNCSGQHSCKIDIRSDACFQHYIYYNYTYECFVNQSCNFDNLCGWNIDTSGVEWKQCVNKSECDSNSPRNGSFMFVIFGTENPHLIARLISPEIMPSSGNQCISFWYHISSESLILYLKSSSANKTIWNISNAQSSQWEEVQINIAGFNQSYMLVFEARNSNSRGHVAIDDVMISNNECRGLVKHTQTCIDTTQSVPLEMCPKYQFEMSFEPELEDCSEIYHNVSSLFKAKWESQTNVNFNSSVTTYQDCFRRKKFSLIYSCAETTTSNKLTTSSSEHDGMLPDNSNQPSDSSQSIDTTTSNKLTTSSSEHDGMLPDNSNQPSDSSQTIGLSVGLICSIGFIVVMTILIWCFVRRSQHGKKFANHDDGTVLSDYTGHQAEVLPEVSLQLSNNGYSEVHIGNDNHQDFQTKHETSLNSLHKSKYSKSNKSENSTSTDGPTNQDFTSLKVKTPPQCHKTTQGLSDNNAYELVAPRNERGFDTKRKVDRGGDYAVLDPSETGFNRLKCNFETKTQYEIAAPINPTQIESNLQDHYFCTKNGTYDTSHNIPHNEVDTSLYSHAVDNVYDTSSHDRKGVKSDITYDHFFGQETEDNYNVIQKK